MKERDRPPVHFAPVQNLPIFFEPNHVEEGVTSGKGPNAKLSPKTGVDPLESQVNLLENQVLPRRRLRSRFIRRSLVTPERAGPGEGKVEAACF
jgi:hypothetical protein